MATRNILLVLIFCMRTLTAQAPLHAIQTLPWRTAGPVIDRPVAAGEPFTVAGPQGIVVGQQQGPFEAWILPVKILSHLTLEASVEGYPVPLDLNSMARHIEVRPDHTTITYSHIAVTVRQTMFAPDDAPTGTGAVVLFEIDAVRPVTLTVRFTPELREMWPKLSSGTPSAEWVPRGRSGYYILHSDFPDLAAAIALPTATAGIMAPYQERPQVHPLELILHFDPAIDRNRSYPLLMAMGQSAATASNAALEQTLRTLNDRLPALYDAHVQRYAHLQDKLTSIVTPDAALNDDLLWAETSIDQLRARTAPSALFPQGELGLVAGYYASGDSARPGFGWFFGRDTLYTTYAINSYGDFALTRTALEFLLRRQRADGKVMHEYSQTAGQLVPPNDWASFPYEYAAADSTPLMLTVMLDYVRSSGDLAFLRAHSDQVRKAWRFESTHDSDGDGIYDNAQGTGWVESWPTGMPHQEIYLALLDQQASAAMAQLAALMGDAGLAQQASARAEKIHATIEREYFNPQTAAYAFSRDAQGKLDTTATIYPAIAWWNSATGAAGATLDHPDVSMSRWAGHLFDTDWGLRDIAENDPFYDATSYHQGSVWPLFTGWASLAQYRSGHPLAGYQALMQNAHLTTAQDPGAATELLSGAFFEPFGRSTSHQLWSSAMVITPLLRGLFGIDVDALHQEVHVSPHLPASWPSAEVHHLHVGSSEVDLHYMRQSGQMVVVLQNVSGPVIHLASGGSSQSVKLPAVEVDVQNALPARGARTQQPKITTEMYAQHSLSLTIEAPAGSVARLNLVRNRAGMDVKITGATLEADDLSVHFPAGDGYQSQIVVISWTTRDN